MVKTLPFQDLQVPSPGFGAMGLSFGLGTNLTPAQAEPVLLKAIELGCTFWDTAVSIHTQFPPPCEREKLECRSEEYKELKRVNRSSTQQESMRSYWEISSASTTSAIRSSVSSQSLPLPGNLIPKFSKCKHDTDKYLSCI